MTAKANHLIKEKSPYLLQHAHNPVNWYAWGEDAFQKARTENKPIFLSIGYSTCHWCHVMEHESFENEEIAQTLNDHFVSIKVDREERPDIDQVYMTAVSALTGQGGWPLSVFLTPEKKPFWGGTYFPPYAKWGSPGFKEILLSLQNYWTNQPDQILRSSIELTAVLQGSAHKGDGAGPALNATEVMDAAYQQFVQSFDPQFGGFGQSPKFPMGHSLSFLLRYWNRNKNSEALAMVEKTLTAMADGGIYDHLGYGFHRYSTDPEWQVPHFEKMLYDQAILARAYLEAYQVTHKAPYARTAREIFDYVLRDMQDKEGGFYCAEDADSLEPTDERGETRDESSLAHRPSSAAKKEGAFYIWKEEEILDLLAPPDAKIFIFYYGIAKNGNARFDPHGEFTGKNILAVTHDLQETARHFQKSPEEIAVIIRLAKEKLLAVRSQRPRPHLDDKVIVDWNGLMISSLAFGSQVLQEPRYKEAAQKAARFILDRLVTPEGRLLHRYRDGEAGITATLDDYAFFVHGLIDLYEATFDVSYLKKAGQLNQEMINLFADQDNGGFFMTAKDGEELIFRSKESYDGAVPSGNSIAAFNLVRLYHLTLREEWQSRAESLIKSFARDISSRPSAYAQMLWVVDFLTGPSREIVLVGPKEHSAIQEMTKMIYSKFLPNMVMAQRPAEASDADEIFHLIPFMKTQKTMADKPTFYICENHVCRLPLTDIEKAEELLAH